MPLSDKAAEAVAVAEEADVAEEVREGAVTHSDRPVAHSSPVERWVRLSEVKLGMMETRTTSTRMRRLISCLHFAWDGCFNEKGEDAKVIRYVSLG